MSENNRILSIIVPTYNCEEFIEEGIASITSQLPDTCELILVDDGSSDGTREILRQYEKFTDNVIVLYGDHKGASGSRNVGIDNAHGKYITFMDCDDMLQEGFIESSLKLALTDADLYIFGIEWFPIHGDNEVWSVEDNVYDNNSTFADTYIRTRKLMIYSNCNKFYKKCIIDDINLRFKEGYGFGEDRLFNYDYIKQCKGRIVTSSLLQLRYLQRSEVSMSTKYVAHFYDIVMKLHEAKVDCFVKLSKNTTVKEKEDFIVGDLVKEISGVVKRFDTNPREREETFPIIEKYLDADGNVDAEEVRRAYVEGRLR